MGAGGAEEPPAAWADRSEAEEANRMARREREVPPARVAPEAARAAEEAAPAEREAPEAREGREASTWTRRPIHPPTPTQTWFPIHPPTPTRMWSRTRPATCIQTPPPTCMRSSVSPAVAEPGQSHPGSAWDIRRRATVTRPSREG